MVNPYAELVQKRTNSSGRIRSFTVKQKAILVFLSLVALCIYKVVASSRLATPYFSQNSQTFPKSQYPPQVSSKAQRTAVRKAFTPVKEYSYDPRAVLIFLDDSEKNGRKALTNDFFTAIAEKTGPIIVSSSLAYNLFRGKGNYDPIEYLSEQEKIDLFELYKGRQLSKEQRQEDQKPILLQFAGFNENDWIIKKISDELVLFIPSGYIEKIGLIIDDVNSYGAQSITVAEMSLGLRVNHMPSVSIVDIQNPKSYTTASYFVSNLRNIFCLKTDYFNEQKLPIWSIFMVGHGLTNKIIVSLSLEEFRQCLEFFNTQIVTRFLVYDSCYTAGLTAVAVYKNAASMLQDFYSYNIISHALAETATSAYLPALMLCSLKDSKMIGCDTKSSVPILRSHPRWQHFIDEASKKEMSIKEAVSKIFADSSAKEKGVVKLAGLEWFVPLDSKNTIVSIGSTLAKTYEGKLNVKKYFGGRITEPTTQPKGDAGEEKIASQTSPEILLLYADRVPFELIINKELNTIISMIPSDAIHILERISSPEKKTEELVDLFTQLKTLVPVKKFFIKYMQGSDRQVLERVVIKNERSSNNQDIYTICYTFGGERMVQTVQAGKNFSIAPKVEISVEQLALVDPAKELKLCDALVREIEDFEQGIATIKEYGEIAITPMLNMQFDFRKNTNSKMQSVRSNNYYIDTFLDKLEEELSNGIMFWLSKVTAPVALDSKWIDPSFLAKYNLKESDIITFINFIFIKGNPSEVYFTYTDKKGKKHFFHNKEEIAQDYEPELKVRFLAGRKQLSGSLLPNEAVTTASIVALKKAYPKLPSKKDIRRPSEKAIQHGAQTEYVIPEIGTEEVPIRAEATKPLATPINPQDEDISIDYFKQAVSQKLPEPEPIPVPSTVSVATAEKSVVLNKRALVVLLDDTDQFKPLTQATHGDVALWNQYQTQKDDYTGDFLSAIAQKAGPLIVSATLAYNLFKGGDPDPYSILSKNDKAGIYVQYKSPYIPWSFFERFPENIRRKKFSSYISSPFYFERQEWQRSILLFFAGFKAEDWLIKKVSEELYLFLPKEHVAQLGLVSRDIVSVTADREVTEVERIVGLRVNHMF